MHHDVVVGLTGMQAEYVRSLINAETESLAEELGKCPPCMDDDGKASELNKALELCELLVNKFERAIDEGIKRNLDALRRA